MGRIAYYHLCDHLLCLETAPGSTVLVATFSVVLSLTTLVGDSLVVDVVCSSGKTGFLSCGNGGVTIPLASAQQTMGSLLSNPHVIGKILLLRALRANGHREICVQNP